jgi:hypothetical protein
LGLPAGAALWAGDVWKRSGRQSIRSRILEVTRIDDRFDEFWQRRSRTAKHLIAVRTRALLDWRFGQRMRSGKAAIIALEDEGGMAGYMILIRRDRAGLKNLQLADLQVLTDNPVHVQDLILAGLDHARSAGVDIVEMQGFNEFKRTAALALNPHRHQYPAWQTFYKVLNPVLATPLADRTNWDASPFDSD